jgi:hypothetical protein
MTDAMAGGTFGPPEVALIAAVISSATTVTWRQTIGRFASSRALVVDDCECDATFG